MSLDRHPDDATFFQQLLELDGEELVWLERLEARMPGLLGSGVWHGVLFALQQRKPAIPAADHQALADAVKCSGIVYSNSDPISSSVAALRALSADLSQVRQAHDDLVGRTSRLHGMLEKLFGTCDPKQVETAILKLRSTPPPDPPLDRVATRLDPPIDAPVPFPSPADTNYVARAMAIASAEIGEAITHPAPPNFQILTCGCGRHFHATCEQKGRPPMKCWNCLGSEGRAGRIRSFSITLKEVATRATSKSGG